MKAIFLFPFLIIGVVATAQHTGQEPLSYTQSVSISPLSFADVDNTALVGAEYRLKSRLSLLTDAGYIFQSTYVGDAQRTRGFALRPALRLYSQRHPQSYAQMQLAYKMATYHLYDWLGKDVANGVPAYEQLQAFRFRKQTMSVNLMTGRVFRLFGDNVLMDLYLGFGVKFKYQHIVNEPHSSYERLHEQWLDLYREKMTTVNLPMGLKVAVVIK